MAAEVEAIARAWMAHQGYTEDEVNATHTHQAYGCESDGNYGWDCFNEDGNSNHPVWDELEIACEMARVAVEALESIGWGPAFCP